MMLAFQIGEEKSIKEKTVSQLKFKNIRCGSPYSYTKINFRKIQDLNEISKSPKKKKKKKNRKFYMNIEVITM